MAHGIVKIITDHYGEFREKHEQFWHLIDGGNQRGSATLCGGEFFGYGESKCIYQADEVEKGGIDCPECLRIIKYYKTLKVKL